MWREITEADFMTSLTGPEAAAFRSVVLQGGQEDPLEEVIRTATNEARGYIAGCDRNTLADGCTVPESMIHQIISIIRHRFISRLPIKISDARQQEYRDARTYLRDVSACRVGIEQPESGTETDESFTSAGPSIESRPSRFSRHHQDGI